MRKTIIEIPLSQNPELYRQKLIEIANRPIAHCNIIRRNDPNVFDIEIAMHRKGEINSLQVLGIAPYKTEFAGTITICKTPPKLVLDIGPKWDWERILFYGFLSLPIIAILAGLLYSDGILAMIIALPVIILFAIFIFLFIRSNPDFVVSWLKEELGLS